MSNSILLTGATGFIGQALTAELLDQRWKVVAGLRQLSADLSDEVTQHIVGDISSSTDWSKSLKDINVIIHVAGRAHILKETVDTPIEEFRKVNTAATLNLARQAVAADVSRFVFISSIGVNGNYNTSPFLETDLADPQESYAISKYEAELELLALAKVTGIEIVIIRPPLVYGPKAPGNFGSLVRWINKGIPLPLGMVNNQRSLIALDNLVSFIIHCIDHPKAANEIFLISDGENVSTTELLRKVSKAFGKKSLLIPVPISWMKFAAKLIGKVDVANRLFGSLQVDSSKARDLLGWKPVVTMDQQLAKMAKDTQ
jgi:UDP-N-acetyl-alpha-D-quinovosamine dehydrogenase